MSIENATLVLLGDPNDGYDEVWAFEDADEAQLFITVNDEYYAGGRYNDCNLARVITKDDIGKFSLPGNMVPAGLLRDAMESIEPEAESDDEDDEDDEFGGEFGEDFSDEDFDEWLNNNRDKYSSETPGLFWGDDAEDDEEED